ncbi:MAG: hypothetical protein ACHQVS_04195 [Candidatus Babeliales bacterium]
MFNNRRTLSAIFSLVMLISQPTSAASLVNAQASAGTMAAAEAEDYTTGKTKITQILSDENLGVAAYNKAHIHYAETQNLAKDLQVNEIANFFGCKTEIGRTFIAQTLSCPVKAEDKETVLLARQQAIRTLVENAALREEVGKLLEQAKHEEQDVIKLMSEFFKGKTCPDLAKLEIVKKQYPAMYPLSEFMIMNPTGKAVGTALNTISLLSMAALTGYCAKSAYTLSQAGQPYGFQAGLAAYYGLFLAYVGYEVNKDYSTAAEKRQKMHALNQLIAIAQHCETLCTHNGIKTQFNMSNTHDAQSAELVKQLQHARYAHKNTVFFNTALVHTFLYRLYQQEKHLAHVFACIAEMDAYHAIATKIVESQNSNNRFCFAIFVDAKKPRVITNDFWNVLVKNAVTSNLTEDRHIILTGPNAGGKTTTIRALLQNIVLGQSFGVAAAQHFEFTMFDVIHSYLNISDDLINGLSLFASEVKRAQDILQKMKSLEQKTKFFFALDELFTGTVAEDGEACAYNFVKKIAEFDGVQFVYATHFNKLKELGNDSALCVNYKVDAPTKNAEGKLVYPYTLSQGANEARVALDLAREANLFA